MAAQPDVVRPRLGMVLTFKASASQALAGIPGTVVEIWPRFRSGDYLVTLEYDRPVRLDNTLIRHIGAFASELEQPGTPRRIPPTRDAWDVPAWFRRPRPTAGRLAPQM